MIYLESIGIMIVIGGNRHRISFFDIYECNLTRLQLWTKFYIFIFIKIENYNWN